MPQLWHDIAARASIVLSETQVAALNGYLDRLLAANETMNLTRIESREQAELLHVADSLTVLAYLPAAKSQVDDESNENSTVDSAGGAPAPQPSPSGRGSRNMRLADVGTGGGLPGIPIAIARPDMQVTLIDATQKKAAFLEQTARELGLANVKVIADRSENLRGHQFDIVTARALAAMDKLITLCLPLVRPGGTLLAMKGPKAREELGTCAKTIRHFRGQPPLIHDAKLPGREHLIIQIDRRG